MKLPGTLLLPLLVGGASATPEASVYIFPATTPPSTSTPPSLSLEQARLVFAQRLGASQYHGLGKASEDTISYINQFGGHGESLFEGAKDKTPELVLVVEGVSEQTAGPLLQAWSSIKPAFTMKDPPSVVANSKLIADLMEQTGKVSGDCRSQKLHDAINPFDSKCWEGKSKIFKYDLTRAKVAERTAALMDAEKRLLQFAEKGDMNVAVILMPGSARFSAPGSSPYGAYEMPSKRLIGAKRSIAEEPMTEAPTSSSSVVSFSNKQVLVSNSSSNSTPFKSLPPSCYASLDDCIKTTRNCSGHGACYKKYGNADSGLCFACGCTATNETFLYNQNNSRGYMLARWGGSACQKKDVSEPFWLISAFTIVMVGLVSWGIGMLFSIGEEKLPGVIGAGVSSKAR